MPECPKCKHSMVISKNPYLVKGKRYYQCMEHCTSCGYISRTWTEG